MTRGADNDLSNSLLDRHPTFRRARTLVLSTVTRFGPVTLDDVARLSALPTRTVLLVVARLAEFGLIDAVDGRLISPYADDGRQKPSGELRPPGPRRVPEEAFKVYAKALASIRPEPALLWTQRWLTPQSARWRAEYIVNHSLLSDGPIVFFGEDDAVSPLVALLEPDRQIMVIDVDSAVLAMVATLASELGAHIEASHHDLSQGSPPITTDPAAVVCDPFPTNDGGFERAFWSEAARTLSDGALLFTTSHPSHKPSAFARPALRALDDVGFTLVDAMREAGEYATFEFELMDYERRTLEANGLTMATSHTKSLLCAVRAGTTLPPRMTDLEKSPVSLAGHYLTLQYGLEDQMHIAATRGKEPINATPPHHLRAPLLDVSALLKGLGSGVLQTSLKDIVDHGSNLVAVRGCLKDAGLSSTETDAEALVLLHRGSVPPTLAGQKLYLVIRALESWNR